MPTSVTSDRACVDTACRRPSGGAAGALVLLLAAGLHGGASAQAPTRGEGDFPAKPVRMVAGFAAGGGSDTICRPVAAQMSAGLGQQVIVDNRVGAGNSIAAELVVKSAPDGYTILCVNANHTLNPVVYDNLPYDTERDLTGISQISASSLILIANPALAAGNVKELVALARAKPNTLNAGTIGTAGSGAVTTAMLKLVAAMPFVIVPYKAAGEAMLGLVRGDVQFAVASQASAMPFLKAGKVKVLAVHSKSRLAYLPDVPTLAESGLHGLDLGPWEGIVAPAKTPPALIDRLNREIVRALRQPEVIKVYASAGVDPVGSSPAEFNEFIRGQLALFRKSFKDGRIAGS